MSNGNEEDFAYADVELLVDAPATQAQLAPASLPPPSSLPPPISISSPGSLNSDQSDGGGKPFGKYTLKRRIGTGGMAHVYLATLDGPDGFKKKLVVKRVHPHLSELDEFAQMFANEAKVAALLHHPNIMQIYEYGTIEQSTYLAMEYVEGPSLERLMRNARKLGSALGPENAARIAIAVCEALQYAHDLPGPDGGWLGLVHRDVSPSNVIVAVDGTVKLLDFGIAKITQGPSVTRTGTFKGKLAYMAPEQLRGSVDRRTDIFALGVVLYEMVVGRRLFKRATEPETVTAVMQGDVPRPSDFIENFPRDFEAILERALERDPNRRYQSAEELGMALEDWALKHGVRTGRRELAPLVRDLGEAGGSNSIFPGSSSYSGKGSASVPPPASGIRGREGEASDPLASVAELMAPVEEGGVDPVWAILGVAACLVATIGVWWFLLM